MLSLFEQANTLESNDDVDPGDTTLTPAEESLLLEVMLAAAQVGLLFIFSFFKKYFS